jgi:hypothetical protein
MGRNDSKRTKTQTTKETGGMTEVQMRKSGRYYWPPDDTGNSFPSVTMITGKLDKSGALSGSAAKITATYAVENMLAWENLTPDDAIKQIKAQYRDEWNGKASRGSKAHTAIAEWLVSEKAGDPDFEVSDIDMIPFVAGAAQFVMDNVKKIGAIEQTVFNLTYKYAGTFDALCQLTDGTYAIVDWKTGGIYEETSLQLAAYAHAEFIGRPDGTQTMLSKPITKGIAVQIPGDGTYTAYITEFDCGGKCLPRKECAPFRGFVGLRGVQKWEDLTKPKTWVEKRKGTTEDTAA